MNCINRLTRDNPRYQSYLDTAECYQVSKTCPSVYGGFEEVEGFGFSKVGIDGILYGSVLPMTRCVLGTNFIGETEMMYQSFYDGDSDQPEYGNMCHRTIHQFHDNEFRRIRPFVGTTRTIGAKCCQYAWYRSVGLDSRARNYVCNPYYTPNYDVTGED